MTSNSSGLIRFRFHILVVLLGLFAAAALVEIAAVFGEGFPDWYLHAAMWGLLLTYGFLALTRFWEGKRFRPWIYSVIFVALSSFWISVMARLIPASEVLRNGVLAQREPMSILWVSIVLLALTGVGVVILGVIVPKAVREKAASNQKQ